MLISVHETLSRVLRLASQTHRKPISRNALHTSMSRSNTSSRSVTPEHRPQKSTLPEGCIAVHKPRGISSAQVLRDLQHHFNPSSFFAPLIAAEKANRERESRNQKNRRSKFKSGKVQVKLGHGGTLDPLATGVLIVGIGKGTKELNRFLHCTKSYECVVLFGAATDTYDCLGKVVARKGFKHITRKLVEEKLEGFRGKYMQKPPIYSAKSVHGKRLYEYAREGKEVPVKIEECSVEVTKLEMVEWMDGGSHDYRWPETEAGKEEVAVAEKLTKLNGADTIPGDQQAVVYQSG